MAGGTWKSEALGAPAEPSRPRPLRAALAVAIVACPALAAAHALAWLGALRPADAPLALAALFAGLLGADLVTGAVHWACDTWGDEHTPWVGPGLIRAFREHHCDPEAMLEHDWIDVNGEPAAAAALAYAVLAIPALQSALLEQPLLYALVWSLVGLAALGNQAHQWAHARAVPAPVRALRRCGLLTPERHARHHRAPYERAYCITSGLLNRPLDALGFWRGLERAVARAAGARPRRD